MSKLWRSNRRSDSERGGFAWVTLFFLPNLAFQRVLCGFDFGGLFARTRPASESASFPSYFYDERFRVFRSCRRNHFIRRSVHGDALQNLLELAFGINVDRCFTHMLKSSMSFAQNESACCCEIAVEINRADNRFEGVTQSGNAGAAAAGFFAAAH